ncbi:type II secretion system protein N [Comamonas sp. GB3 AK4-5]|uniref:type II secretion system protein N n=1 Tax=Comamonas sp. GB3 AK4-5 TaxID=3231487 RepID=UPI00351F45C3
MVHTVGALIVAGGLCFWGMKLLDVKTQVLPPPAQALPAADPAGKALAEWLGPGEVRLNVAVLGLAQRSDRAVALLSINGAAPQPYLVGEPVMQSVTLKAIDADGVVLERAGRAIRIHAPVRPVLPSKGIEHVH